jgi:HD-GYP domain-containing protein (c-di-GMP phosphodiesterase class II)
VTYHAVRIARKLGLPVNRIVELKEVCILHDLGKLAIDRDILNKREPLSAAEWAEIKRHSEIGARIIGRSPALKPLAPIVRHHHEKYAGGGYPNPRMRDGRIPLLARIISVADAWDAMRSNRIYRKALSKRKAIAELKRGSGRQFDPKIVSTFLSLL